jgi:hypothetical protein
VGASEKVEKEGLTMSNNKNEVRWREEERRSRRECTGRGRERKGGLAGTK